MRTIILGGGCFWCTEAIFQQVKGVLSVTSGFAGGGTDLEPDYWKIHSDEYDHAEVVKIEYDESIVNLKTLLEIFFGTHDPTTTQQTGTADSGNEYRSIILCSEDELETAKEARDLAQKLWDKPIITEIRVLDKFYPAEEYHQNYYQNNQQAPYCQVIINPKLNKLQSKFSDLLK